MSVSGIPIKDYRCPKDCPERTRTCHSECERHEKYRALNEELKKKKANDALYISMAADKKIRGISRW